MLVDFFKFLILNMCSSQILRHCHATHAIAIHPNRHLRHPAMSRQRQPDTATQGDSQRWSCTTLGDGIDHVEKTFANDDLEKELLQQLQD